MAQNESLMYFREAFFGEFLKDDHLTEIAVNRPHQLFTKSRGVWQEHEVPMTLDDCRDFATALASFNDDNVDDLKPILSAVLETGERCQIVMPPACERGTVSITIRKPSMQQIPHQSYIDAGFYNRVQGKERKTGHNDEIRALWDTGCVPDFMEACVRYGKTMLITGGTGGGKTTYMKTLMGYLPHDLRIITIEDVPELFLFGHRNYVHLYYPAEAGANALITPASLLRANFRMNPDRILLAEVRGAETWDFMKSISSGHEGGITSVHEDSPHAAIEGVIERCYQHPECQNLPYSVLLRKVLNNIDVIASVTLDGELRRMSDIYYKDVHREQYVKEFRNENG